jgi:hypothetical protein
VAEAFSTAQFDTAYPPGLERHWWCLARARMIDSLLRSSGVAGAPILEVGCGTGMVVESLRAQGYDCRGVEPAPVEPLASVRAHVTAGCEALALAAPERARVQTILLLDVLEHLDEPAAFLASLEAGFPLLSRVIVTVPARRELWSNYDEFYGHRLRYDLRSLAAVAAACGWTPARIGYAFRLAYLPALLMAQLGLRREVVLRGPAGALSIAAHRAVAALSWMEWSLLPARVPGSSAFACFAIPGR